MRSARVPASREHPPVRSRREPERPVSAVLTLQRSAGNAAVAAVLSARRLQRMRAFRAPEGDPIPDDELATRLLQHLEREVFPLLAAAERAAEEDEETAVVLASHRHDLDRVAAALAGGRHTPEANQLASERIERVRVWYEATAGSHGWPRGLQDLGALVPARGARPGRTRFGVQPGEWKADIGNRAAVDAWAHYDTAEGKGGGAERLTTGAFYRRHPAPIDLNEAFAGLGAGAQISVEIPRVRGEVMYVITVDYRLIIGARSGSQHQFPHPTLVGGDEPEVLSAGIVEFEEGRIRRVKVNDSGHFRPNAPSSFEVAAGLLERLPPSALHRDFEMTVYREGGPRALAGPVGEDEPRFEIQETEIEVSGKAPPTPAVALEHDVFGIGSVLKSKDWRKAAKQVLLDDIASATGRSRFDLVFDGPMRRWFAQLTMQTKDLPERDRRREAVGDEKFEVLLAGLLTVLERLRRDK